MSENDAPPDQEVMNQSAQYCFSEVRKNDPERFLCGVFATGLPRDDLMAVYAFNLELGRTADTVTEPGLGLIRLQWWRDTVSDVYRGVASDSHPVAACLAAAAGRNELPQPALLGLIDWRTSQFSSSPASDDNGVVAMAEQSGGELGRLAAMCLPGGKEPASQRAAGHVGTAWALVGMVRAMPHNAARNRVLLPRSLLERHQLSAEDVIAGNRRPAMAAMVAEILDLAERQLAAAHSLRRQIARSVLPALLPAVLARAHIRRLRRTGHDPAAVAPHLSPFRRAAGLLVANALGRY